MIPALTCRIAHTGYKTVSQSVLFKAKGVCLRLADCEGCLLGLLMVYITA